MTLGYPGEGPPTGPKTPPKELNPRTPPKWPSRHAPVRAFEVPGSRTSPKGDRPRTPPKDSRPRSPPKAKRPTPPEGPLPSVSSHEVPSRNMQRSTSASSGTVPPWAHDLESEVKELATSYLRRSSGDVGIHVTESRRILAPPKAKASQRQPPPPPAPRASAQTRTAGGATSQATCKPVVPKERVPPLPPPSRRHGPSMPTGRVVKAKFQTGFEYEAASAVAKDYPSGYRQIQGLPCVRPAFQSFYSPDGHRQQGGSMKPTPKTRELARAQVARQQSGDAIPSGSISSGSGREQAYPKSGDMDIERSPSGESSHDLADRRGSLGPEVSPEPAIPKGPQSLDLMPLMSNSGVREKEEPGVIPESEPAPVPSDVGIGTGRRTCRNLSGNVGMVPTSLLLPHFWPLKSLARMLTVVSLPAA